MTPERSSRNYNPRGEVSSSRRSYMSIHLDACMYITFPRWAPLHVPCSRAPGSREHPWTLAGPRHRSWGHRCRHLASPKRKTSASDSLVTSSGGSGRTLASGSGGACVHARSSKRLLGPARATSVRSFAALGLCACSTLCRRMAHSAQHSGLLERPRGRPQGRPPGQPCRAADYGL